MPVTLQHDYDTAYRLDITGRLYKVDQERAERELASHIARSPTGTVRLLVVLTDFEGWEAGANWSDLTFFATGGQRIARIAIVGDERWRHEAMMFAAADLRPGPVEYFGPADLDAARAWLAG